MTTLSQCDSSVVVSLLSKQEKERWSYEALWLSLMSQNQMIHFPKWGSERITEYSGARERSAWAERASRVRERSNQCGASKWARSVSKWANRAANGPVPTPGFLVVLDHSAKEMKNCFFRYHLGSHQESISVQLIHHSSFCYWFFSFMNLGTTIQSTIPAALAVVVRRRRERAHWVNGYEINV